MSDTSESITDKGKNGSKRAYFPTLRVQLLILVLLALTPASVIMFYTAVEQRRMATAEMEANAFRLFRPAAMQYERIVEGTRHLLRVMARLPEVRSGSPEESAALFRALRAADPLYANIGVIRRDGTLISSAIPSSGPVSLRDRDYFRRAVQTRDFAAGEYQIGRVTGKPSINFGYPVIGEAGQVERVVFAALDLGWLREMSSEAGLPPGATLTLLDREGNVLTRYPGPEGWVGKPFPLPALVKLVLSQERGVVSMEGPDGVERVYAFTRLQAGKENVGAYLVIGFPKGIAFDRANSILARNLAALWLVGLLTLVAAWVGGNWLVLGRLNRLVTATQRLSAGDTTARTGLRKARDELGELAGAFDRMAGSLEAAQTELLKAEEEKKRFYREVIKAVTHGKFHLVDEDEIPASGELIMVQSLENPEDYPALRKRLREALADAGMKKKDIEEMVLATGEAATNAIKHATNGVCRVYLTTDRVTVRVEDEGAGIRPEDLPATILQAGFSTKVSLGMGYTLMLELADQVWLSTGPGGTTVQLEQWLHPERHTKQELIASWERF